ncbi:glucokinase [Aquimonas sp.]|jgi:glucokinase|uniref:glucokinase n=1 Tax=Aquimonas sp. TaxID=1872588 RepID=UPI0037C09D22
MLDHALARADQDVHAQAECFIAADVGGTHARLALIDAGNREAPHLRYFRSYACREHRDLGALMRHYLTELNQLAPSLQHPHSAVIACAGYVLDDKLVHANLPWAVDLAVLRRSVGLDQLAFVNDFEAVAIAVARLPFEAMDGLLSPAAPPRRAPILVLGAGTGFGAALCVPIGDGLHVLATEAGQAGFAPATADGLALLTLWRQRQPQVRIEDLLSGPGLLRIYRGLCELGQQAATFETPAAVSRAASSDALAARAVEVFCAELGSVCADLLLATGAQGGVRLAGGVLPHLRANLLRGEFQQRFHDKGAMRAQLERVPVHLVEHGDLGVLGAARWHLAGGV